MEARKLTLDICTRFIQRIQLYLGVYLALAGLGTFFIVFVILGYIKFKLTLIQWICVGTVVGVLDIYCVLIMFPYSYINEQSRWQLKRLVFLKSVLQRITCDERLLGSNVKRIRQVIIFKAVSYLQKETADIEDQAERREKMLEMAGAAMDTVNEAIDLLEKELEHRPQKLLGITMYPDQITGLLTTGVLFAFTTLSSKLGM